MRTGKLANGFWGPDFARHGHRAGTKRHEQEQARRKKARATPGHPLREPFKYAKRVELECSRLSQRNPQALALLGSMAQEGAREMHQFAGHMNRVALTAKHPSGRIYRGGTLFINGKPLLAQEILVQEISSGDAPIARRS